MSLDATVAGTSANSYIAVATADGFAGDDLGAEAVKWLDAGTVTATKEKALKRATRELDAYLRTGWPPYSTTQALLFPRAVDVVSSSPVIPRSIQLACYQQAIYLVANADVLAAANTRRARAMSSASEPNVAFTETADDGSNELSPQALQYLSGYRIAARPQPVGSLRSLRVQPGFQGW
jgi:hypothetical protein